MAQSRLEKVGTIYTRITNLLKGGVLKQDELPVWYAVYKAFPPKYEPKIDRPGSLAPVKNIFYTEDIIRAKFQKDFKNTLHDLTSQGLSRTEQFIEDYRKLEKEGVPESELYNTTKEKYVSMFQKSQAPKATRNEEQPEKSSRIIVNKDLFKGPDNV